ncbi:hypothetical protein Efla_006677 [Eimeria flavescens]
MLRFKLLFLTGASLVCLIGAHGVDYTKGSTSASRVSCLDAMNPYRQAAGFSAFESHEILPVSNTILTKPGKDAESNLSSFLTSVCTSMQTASPRNPKVAKTVKVQSKEDATYAVHVQTGQTANCSAAVDHWKEALVNFGRLPPAYNADSEPYNDLQNVSFVALFNPKANAKVDCAYVTCPRRTAKPQTGPLRAGDPVESDKDPAKDKETPELEAGVNGSDAPQDDAYGDGLGGANNSSTVVVSGKPAKPPGGVHNGNNPSQDATADGSGLGSNGSVSEDDSLGNPGEVYEEVRVLVCASQPAALTANSKPFTEEEFKRITDSLSSSAFVAGPTLLALSTASLSLLAF